MTAHDCAFDVVLAENCVMFFFICFSSFVVFCACLQMSGQQSTHVGMKGLKMFLLHCSFSGFLCVKKFSVLNDFFVLVLKI